MTKIAAVLLAVLLAVGMYISGPGTLYASEEVEAGEEFIEEKEMMDADEYRQFLEEEGEQLEDPEHEGEAPEEEEQDYPDETYQEERG
jgi:hypothetical protein